MSDVPFDTPGIADPPDDERLPQLARAGETPSERFLDNVLDGINARQTSTQALEMSWWGLTGLVFEMIDTLFRAVGLREDDDKES